MRPSVKIFTPGSRSNGRSQSAHLRTSLFFRQINFWGFSAGSGEKAKHSGSPTEDACVKREVTSCRDQPGDRRTTQHRVGTPPRTDLISEGRRENGPPARSQQQTHTWWTASDPRDATGEHVGALPVETRLRGGLEARTELRIWIHLEGGVQPLENFKLASNVVRRPTGRLGVSNPEKKRVGQTGLGFRVQRTWRKLWWRLSPQSEGTTQTQANRHPGRARARPSLGPGGWGLSGVPGLRVWGSAHCGGIPQKPQFRGKAELFRGMSLFLTCLRALRWVCSLCGHEEGWVLFRPTKSALEWPGGALQAQSWLDAWKRLCVGWGWALRALVYKLTVEAMGLDEAGQEGMSGKRAGYS